MTPFQPSDGSDRAASTGAADAHDDADLLTRFAEARAVEQGLAPPLARTLAGTPARGSSRTRQPWLRPVLALGAVAVLVVGITTWRSAITEQTPMHEMAFFPGARPLPTDFLFDMAPSMRAGEIPAIGVIDWYPLPPHSPAPARDSRRRN